MVVCIGADLDRVGFLGCAFPSLGRHGAVDCSLTFVAGASFKSLLLVTGSDSMPTVCDGLVVSSSSLSNAAMSGVDGLSRSLRAVR